MNDFYKDLFEDLYNKYYNMCYRFILSKVRDPWTAEDLLSEVFIKIYRHRDEINDITKSGSWVIKIANNTVIDFYRKNNKEELKDEMPFETFYESGFDEVLLRDEYTKIIQNLPCEMKRMLEMRFCEELKFREISKIINLPEEKVKRRVYKALRTARELYNYELQNA